MERTLFPAAPRHGDIHLFAAEFCRHLFLFHLLFQRGKFTFERLAEFVHLFTECGTQFRRHVAHAFEERGNLTRPPQKLHFDFIERAAVRRRLRLGFRLQYDCLRILFHKRLLF